MHIPQSGDEELAEAIDDLCVLRDMGLLRWDNRNDAILIDDHSPVGLSGVPSGIDHGDMFNRERLGQCATADKGKDDAQEWAGA